MPIECMLLLLLEPLTLAVDATADTDAGVSSVDAAVDADAAT